MPEKISICLNRGCDNLVPRVLSYPPPGAGRRAPLERGWGCEESVGNDDVSIVRARKSQIVRMTPGGGGTAIYGLYRYVPL